MVISYAEYRSSCRLALDQATMSPATLIFGPIVDHVFFRFSIFRNCERGVLTLYGECVFWNQILDNYGHFFAFEITTMTNIAK